MNKLVTFLKSIKNDSTDPRKNDAWRVLAFSLNDISTLCIGVLFGKLLYYTQNVLMIGVFFASIMLPGRILDAITDPLIAVFFDRFESKRGKFRPIMLAGSLISIVAGIGIFCFPVHNNLPMWAVYTILTFFYFLNVIGSTLSQTATKAGQAVITQDPKQRPLYAIGQTVFDALVQGFVSVVITSGLIGSMQEPYVWKLSIGILSVLAILCVFASMKAISTRDNPTYYHMANTFEGKTDIKEFFRVLKRSKPMRSLVVATSSDAIAASVRAQLKIYLFANIIMNRGLTAAFDLLNGIVIGAPVLAVGMYFASKRGSALVYKIVSIVQTFICVAGFLVTTIVLPANPDYAYKGVTFNIILVLLILGSYMGSLGISQNLVNAMTGDLADYEYIQSGKFIPGTIGATLGFFKKVCSSVVGLITMGIMLFCGFASSGEGSKVPENVFVNYRFYYCVLTAVFLLPALGHLITWISMRKYPITEEVMEEVSMEMARRRGVAKEENTIDGEDVVSDSEEHIEESTVSYDQVENAVEEIQNVVTDSTQDDEQEKVENKK